MTQELNAGGTDQQPLPESAKHEDAGLAQAYQQAAAGDAYHERKSGGPMSGGKDPMLATNEEIPGVPLRDFAKADKADGEDHAAPPSDKGPEYDRLMRGLEPGETSAE